MAAAKNTAPKKRPTPEKRDKTNKIRAARNKATKSALKTVLKKAYVGGNARGYNRHRYDVYKRNARKDILAVHSVPYYRRRAGACIQDDIGRYGIFVYHRQNKKLAEPRG